MKEFDADLDEVIARAKDSGIELMQTICTKLEDIEGIIKIAEKYPQIYASVGVHPHDADKLEEKDLVAKLLEIATHKKIIGIGETGLDYYYEYSHRKNQQDSFNQHIEASQNAQLPLIIHTRMADDDTISMLTNSAKHKEYPGLIHCFSSSRDLAFKCLDLGMYISISGIITFNKAEELREVVRDIPLEKLLVETDAPYLAPVPMRGKRNEPSFTKHVAAKIAEIKNLSLEEVAETTTRNFYKLFSKIKNDKLTQN